LRANVRAKTFVTPYICGIKYLIMRGKFLSGITFFFALNILIKPIWVFGIDMVVQNRVGADVYGSYFALLNVTLMFAILLDLGINMSNTRNVAGDASSIKSYFPSLFFLRIFLLVLFALVVGALGVILGYNRHMLGLLGWMVVNQFLLSSILFIRSYVGGLQWFNWDAFLSVADKILVIIIVGAVLFTSDSTFQIEYLIGGQTIAYSLALLTGVGILRKQLLSMHWAFDRSRIWEKLRQALPYATLILVMGLYTRLDGVMIERMKGSEASGMYAGAFRLLDIAIQIGVLYSFVLIPVFTKRLQSKQLYGSLMRSSFNLLLSVSLSAAVAAVVFHQELVALFYQHSTRSMGVSLAVLMATLPAFYMGYLFGSALTAGGKTTILNRIALGGLFINFVLNIALIHLYAEVGAAIATAITQWSAALLQMWAAKRVFRIRIDPKQWTSLAALVILQTVVYLILNAFIDWHYALVIGGAWAALSPFAFQLININKLKRIRS
jgi:O-antigen/teichoic acid export membrane protein